MKWAANAVPALWPAALAVPALPCPRASISLSATVNDERRLLRGVLVEALERQERKRAALAQQLEAARATLVEEDDPDLRERAERCCAQAPQHLDDADAAEAKLVALKAQLQDGGALGLPAVRRAMVDELALGPRLLSYDPDAARLAQWGRPSGFTGLVLESPRGVPTLVAPRSYSDELLRRVSRGTDLWFQAVEGRGSRVLLRASMVRGLSRASRECVENAAHLAAYFSDQRYADEVEVMWTDSRKVARRGGRVGQMKATKKLGALWARPELVASVAREAQEEQGWL